MITGIVAWLVGSRLGKALSAILSALVILLGVFHYGKRQATSEARTEALEDHLETKERVDEVEPSADRDTAIERMRSNGLIRRSDLRDTIPDADGE